MGSSYSSLEEIGEIKTTPIQNADTNVHRTLLILAKLSRNDPHHQPIETNKMRPICKMKHYQ